MADSSNSVYTDPELEAAAAAPPPGCSPTATLYRSVCTPSTAEEYAAKYEVPPEYGLFAPGAGERAHAPPPGYAAVYGHHFLFGLRLPLQPFLVSVLAHYKVALTQLHPNSIGAIVGFIELCKTVSIAPTVNLFRHFFYLRPINKTKGWYSICSNPPKIVELDRHVAGWKTSFLFFKTENVTLPWNYSAITDSPLAEEDGPSEHTVNMFLANVKHKPEENGTDFVPKSCSSKNATWKPNARAPETPRQERLKRKAEFDAKTLRGPTEKKCVVCSRVPSFKDSQLKGDKEELQKAEVSRLQDMESKIASLEREKADVEKENALLKSRLKSVVGDRGPLLRVYTQKLLESQAFSRLFYDLTTSAQRFGRHEAAEHIQDRFPAIPEDALVGLQDPLAALKLENMLCDVVHHDAFKFTLLDHLISLPEIPTSSQLKHLDVEEDLDSLIGLPSLHA